MLFRSTNLGGGEEINVEELTAIILKAIAGGVMEKGKGVLPLDMIDDLGKGVLGVGQEAIEGVGKEIIKGVDDVGKGATEAIRGIFQKKEE